jgi:outer membrane protein assembly factor BamB
VGYSHNVKNTLTFGFQEIFIQQLYQLKTIVMLLFENPINVFMNLKSNCMRWIAFVSLGLFLSASSVENFETVESTLQQHWSVEIGKTSYRTRSAFFSGNICIGSNGFEFMDYALDSQNGVFVIDAANGSIRKKIASESFGDMDVNGVVSDNGKIFFGNDNEEFICANSSGKILWRIPTAGDVEHKPTIIGEGQNKCVVYATETGQIHALHTETGRTAWSYYVPDYNGWKPGDNRSVFKVKMYFSSGYEFCTDPAVVDLNGDGSEDILYNYHFDQLLALDGRTGKTLWSIGEKIKQKYALYLYGNAPMIMGKGKDLRMVAPMFSGEFDEYNNPIGACVGIFDAKGNLIEHKSLSQPIGTPMLSQAPGVFITTTTIIRPSANQKNIEIIPISDVLITNWDGLQFSRFGEGQVARKLVQFGGEECVLLTLQNERDNEDLKQSPLLLIGLKSGRILKKAYLPAKTEQAPELDDYNKDGKIDVLVGCYNGQLYCFDLGIPAEQLMK